MSYDNNLVIANKDVVSTKPNVKKFILKLYDIVNVSSFKIYLESI